MSETDTCVAVSDGFSVQGASHHVCQDYAAAASGGADGAGEAAWAVVCDGCSSAPYTDWGARLLTRAASAHVALLAPDDPDDPDAWRAAAECYHDRAVRRAADYARMLDLTPLALTATLLTARTLGDRLVVCAYGDGAVALRERATGRWQVVSLAFAEGKAAYPSYRLEPETLALFRGLEGNERQATVLSVPPGEDACLPPPLLAEADYLLWALPRADYDVVALLTDGIASFTEAPHADGYGARQPVEVGEVLPLLLDFRRMTGGFARRSLRAFQKASRKRGWEHYDDLSLAALYLPRLETGG